MTSTRTSLVVLMGVVVGFACGWLVAQVQNANKISPDQILANNWERGVSLLVKNVNDTRAIPAEETKALIRSGLDIDSKTLGRDYDDLPKSLQARLMFYLPAARAIAVASAGHTSIVGGGDLLRLVDCMQQAKAHGSRVGKCMQDTHG